MDEALPVATPDGGDLHDKHYTDEMTGLPLQAGLVRIARREMAYMEQMSVFRPLTGEEARQCSRGPAHALRGRRSRRAGGSRHPHEAGGVRDQTAHQGLVHL